MGNYSNHSKDELSNIVLGIAIEVHSILDSGLLENVYKQILFHKLIKAGIMVEMEKNMPIQIDDLFWDLGYKMNLLVENKLVLELKSVKEITNVHVTQVINYLKLGKFNLGLILNFNVFQLKSGIKRAVLTEGPRPF